jgi:hypothetical protein
MFCTIFDFMSREKDPLTSFLNQMRAAFTVAREADTGHSRDCFRRMHETVCQAFDQAAAVAVLGAPATAISVAGKGIRKALEEGERETPLYSAGRAFCSSLAMAHLSASVEMQAGFIGRLERQVKALAKPSPAIPPLSLQAGAVAEAARKLKAMV